MKNILTLSILLFLSFISHAQNLTFSKIMTYYISKDEELILNDLRQKKYLIQKEQPAENKLFDSQINCFKPSEIDYSKMTVVVIFKNSHQISAISYITFNTTELQNKLKEIYKRGFKQTVDNPSTHWIFENNDTLVTVEKRNITLNNKMVTRYEISIMNISNFSGGLIGDFKEIICLKNRRMQ